MRFYPLIFCLLIAPTFSLACSCANAGDFCTILPNAIESGNLVVQGSPVRTIGHGIEFEIAEVVSGTETRKRIMIWGDPGYLCRIYVTGFERRDQLLMILSPIQRERTETTTGETERVGDYSISICGEFFIYLNGPNKKEIDCFTPTKGKPSLISVAPNPTQHSFFLITQDLEVDNIVEIKVSNANGQLLFKKSQLAIRPTADNIEIETTTWVNGLYFVEIRTLTDRWLAKVVVVK